MKTKRILSVILSLAMVIGITSGLTITASASSTNCPVCGQEFEWCSGWWNTTETTHQRYCENEMETGDWENHDFDENDKCKVCGFTLSALYQGTKYGIKSVFDVAEDGGTIKLVHSVTEGFFTVTGKKVTLDENGYGVVKINVDNGTSIALTNSAESSVVQGVRLNLKSGGKVTIADGVHSCILSNNNNIGTLEITGGTFKNNYSIQGATISGGVFNSSSNNIVSCTISGGSFKCNVYKSTISGGKFVNDPTATTGTDANTIPANCELVAIENGTDDYIAGYRYKVVENETFSFLYPTYKNGEASDGIDQWKTESCEDYTIVESSTTTCGESGKTKWYVVDADTTIEQTLYIEGDVNLILKDGKTLTVNANQNNGESYGICITNGSSLTIYGQSKSTGKIISRGNATNPEGLGIGIYNLGKLIINGGVIEAYGDNYEGDGICIEGDAESAIFNGGTVTAVGGDCNDTCGGFGLSCFSSFADIIVNGGDLKLIGGNSAYEGNDPWAEFGLYSGSGGNVFINICMDIFAGDSANPTTKVCETRTNATDVSGESSLNKQYVYITPTIPVLSNSYDSGYYAIEKDALEKEGIIAFTSLFSNIDKFIFGTEDKFGMYIYKSGNEANKVELNATDFAELKDEDGYLYSFVTNISSEDFGKTVIAKPFVVINSNVYYGSEIEATVNSNKWLGNVSNKQE